MSKLLSKKRFLESFRLAPRLAICIIIKNPQGKFLLTKRNIPPHIGSWHYPGGFLLKNEKISVCLKRIAKKELGIDIILNKMKLLGIYENLIKDPRAHVIDAIYEYRISKVYKFVQNKETKEAKFFNKIPSNIFPGHDTTLKKLGYN